MITTYVWYRYFVMMLRTYWIKVCMAEWLDEHLGSSRSRVENPARLGASRRSRATSRAPVGIPYVDSYLFAPIRRPKVKKCSKICSAFGISYVPPYVSNTSSPFVPTTVRDWPSLTYEWYHVRETAYATSTTTYCGMWRPATVASKSIVTASNYFLKATPALSTSVYVS